MRKASCSFCAPFECAIRIDELWDTLKDHYTGQNSMINKEITVKGFARQDRKYKPNKPWILESDIPSLWKFMLPNPEEDELRGDCPSEVGKMVI